MRTRIPCLLVAGLALAGAAPADAATVSMPFKYREQPSRFSSGQDYHDFALTAEAGEANRVTVEVTNRLFAAIRVRDAAAPLTPGENCRADGDAVVCTSANGIQATLLEQRIDLGDGHDELELRGMQAAVIAGPGNDRITSDNTGLRLDGGEGADVVRAPGGSVTYAGRTAPVIVTPDNLPNDGEAGEGDDVDARIGTIIGGEGADELHLDPAPGSRSTSRLDGRGGDDRLFSGDYGGELVGGEGDDFLRGFDGRDEMTGGPGADVLRGAGGRDLAIYGGRTVGINVTLDDRRGDGAPGENDDVGSDIETVVGTEGDDVLVGSGGDDLLIGSGGDDLINGLGGADEIHGGPGRNRLIGGVGRDLIEVGGENGSVKARDGEVDEVRCGGLDNATTLDPFDTAIGCAPALTGPDGRTIRVARDGKVRLVLRCWPSAGSRCAGGLRLYEASAVGTPPSIARRRISLRANGRPVRIELRLTARARRQVARRRTLRVSALWETGIRKPPSARQGRFDFRLVPPR